MWVHFARAALVVIPVPVDTRRRFVYFESHLRTGLLGVQEAGSPADAAARHVGASEHSVLSLHRADEGVVVGAIWLVVASQE